MTQEEITHFAKTLESVLGKGYRVIEFRLDDDILNSHPQYRLSILVRGLGEWWQKLDVETVEAAPVEWMATMLRDRLKRDVEVLRKSRNRNKE
jgi:predicted GNAT superfamily acetyltransferase